MTRRQSFLPAVAAACLISAVTLSIPPARAAAADTERATRAAPSEAECQARVNATPARLAECISQDTLWQRLAHFQAIADANPGSDGHGNRDTGTPGYKASVDYVVHAMRQAGYAVRVQPYIWTHSDAVDVPVLRAGPVDLVFGRDWTLAGVSASGDMAARVQSVTGLHGCRAADFAGFDRGAIALMAPGSCDADVQVTNAEAAGARAVIFVPAGPMRGGAPGAALAGAAGGEPGAAPGPASGMVSEPVLPAASSAASRAVHKGAGAGETKARVRSQAGLTIPAAIPVIIADAAAGAALGRQGADGRGVPVQLSVRTARVSDTDYNVIADSPFGDPGETVVVDAHLDAIYGAGMLDNASGSVSILETALALASTPTRNRLRYVWFGGEELGLLGSHYYTRHLSPGALRQIAFDIDVDVTATPNFDVLIADPGQAANREQFPPNVVPQSQTGNQAFSQLFQAAGVPSRYAGFGNDGTDSNAFSLVGVPNTGVLTNQDCCKAPWEVRIWGGFTGDYEGTVPGVHEACVDRAQRWCDNLSNNDPVVFGIVSAVVAQATLQLANTDFSGGR